MNTSALHQINQACLASSIVSIACGVLIGILGLWGIIPTSDGLLWKWLGTCVAVLLGSILSSTAIGCFKLNE